MLRAKREVGTMRTAAQCSPPSPSVMRAMMGFVTIDRESAYAAVDSLTEWSEWEPFTIAAPRAPLVPGVYQMRLRGGSIVYVGMAGERKGRGIRGRLSIYRRGKGAVSGFGEAALDRALASTEFIEKHLENVRAGNPARASIWAQDAICWLDVEVRWAICETRDAALALESAVVDLLMTHEIWNRVASRASATRMRSHVGADPTRDAELNGLMTVAQLSDELGRDDGGKAVRRILRAGFPDHAHGRSWDPLSAAQVTHVRSRLAR